MTRSRDLANLADGTEFTSADHTKLDGIETSATADQTNAEIRSAVEAATDSNVFTDADHTKLNAIEASATADQTDAEIKTAVQNVSNIVLAGNPTTTTQSANNNSPAIATTAYTDAAIAALADSAPATLNTLNELAAALGDDANFSTTVTNSIATKLPLSGGAVTGDVTFGDGNKAIFGAGSDLQIYHDGSNSLIEDTGTGNLKVIAQDFILNSQTPANMITAYQNAAVSLFYSGAAKLATTSTGIDVTGTVTADTLDITEGTNARLITSDGIGEVGSGTFAFQITNAAGSALKPLGFRGEDIRFATGSSERMRIDSSGNVGIGVSSPTYRIEAAATSGGNGFKITRGADSFFEQFQSTSGGVQLAASGSGAFLALRTGTTAGTTSERMRIDSSGRLGLKTSANASFDQIAGANLFVLGSGAGDQGMTIYSGNTGTGNIMFADGTTTSNQYEGYIQYVHADNRLLFGSNHATRMTLDSNGILLVGKTSASLNLGGFEARASGEIGVCKTSGASYYFSDTSNYKFYVNANGGIYNYSSNNVNLSDRREKKNIEDVGTKWDTVKAWGVKEFHYNADEDSDAKKVGVIAQDVESSHPSLVTEFELTEDTTRKAVKEQQMMWMAIKALQEAQTRIETLETKVAALEA